MTRVTVQKAYLGSTRVLADSAGRIYDPRHGWIVPAAPVVLAAGAPYERWSDVPASWTGYVPFWSR